jgi:ketosteroid isomerase-like protein
MYENAIGDGFGGPSLHLHPSSDEAFYMLEGESTGCHRDDIVHRCTGSLAAARGSVQHTFADPCGVGALDPIRCGQDVDGFPPRSDTTDEKEIKTMQSDIEELGQIWAAAEQRGDVPTLTAMLTDDFVGIGPLGFMLTKQEWLARHQSGELTYDGVDLDEVTVRVYNGAAVVIGRQGQQATYRGNRVDAELRTTLVFVHQEGQWRLASLHFSPIGQPPFAQSSSTPPSR